MPIKPSAESRYSTDANLLGLTHEAGDLENVEESPYFVEPGMGVWAWDATDKPELISIKWENGIPTKINGDNYSLVEVFNLLNNLGLSYYKKRDYIKAEQYFLKVLEIFFSKITNIFVYDFCRN